MFAPEFGFRLGHLNDCAVVSRCRGRKIKLMVTQVKAEFRISGTGVYIKQHEDQHHRTRKGCESKSESEKGVGIQVRKMLEEAQISVRVNTST